MSKLPISVCIIAKNEEKYIEECLKKLKPYGFEIVVVDTGSTDRTKEIASRYADEVAEFVWINDFSAARNFCAQQATNNWILSIDCDEYIEKIDIKVLRILLQQKAKQVGVIRMKNLQCSEAGDIIYRVCDLPRLYNRNYYRYDKPIHEQIIPIKGDSDSLDGFLMPMEVIHHGYAIKGDDMVKKQERNLEILYAGLKDEPENPYYYFQIGCSLQVLKRYEEAAQYFGIDETLIVAYAKAAGAVYQLSKIRLIKIEPLEDYMKHLTKVGRSSKLIQRKFVRVGEGTLIYNIGRNRFIEMARAAGAVYKIGDSKGSKVLIRLDVFDEYMEQFREKPVEMKHPLWKED